MDHLLRTWKRFFTFIICLELLMAPSLWAQHNLPMSFVRNNTKSSYNSSDKIKALWQTIKNYKSYLNSNETSFPKSGQNNFIPRKILSNGPQQWHRPLSGGNQKRFFSKGLHDQTVKILNSEKGLYDRRFFSSNRPFMNKNRPYGFKGENNGKKGPNGRFEQDSSYYKKALQGLSLAALLGLTLYALLGSSYDQDADSEDEKGDDQVEGDQLGSSVEQHSSCSANGKGDWSRPMSPEELFFAQLPKLIKELQLNFAENQKTAVKLEPGLDFKLQPTILSQGETQMFMNFLGSEEIDKDPLLQALDVRHYHNQKDRLIVVTKSASLMKNKDLSQFSIPRLMDPNYLGAIIPGIKLQKGDEENLLKASVETKFGPVQLGETQFDLKFHEIHFADEAQHPAFSSKELQDLSKMDQDLGTPYVTLVSELKNANKLLDGQMLITKIFPLGPESHDVLIVNYQITSIKKAESPVPLWVLKRVLNYALKESTEKLVNFMREPSPVGNVTEQVAKK